MTPGPTAPPARILIAEDNSLNAAVLRDALVCEGHEVTRVADGRAALDALAAAPFDLLITDGDMPHVDGLTLCTMVRAEESLRALPVIFLTGSGAGVVGALDAGADDYLIKPFDSEDLRARVRAALRMGRLRQELVIERDMSRALIDSLQDGLIVFAESGEILQINERLVEMTGYDRSTLVGARPPYPFWPAEEAAEYRDRFLAALRDGAPGEADRCYAHPSGGLRSVIVSLARLPGASADGPAYVSTVKDVTARRAVEAGLRASEAANRELAREQGSLGLVAAAVAAALPPDRIFELVAREVATLLGAEAGGVARFVAEDAAVLVGSWAASDDVRLPAGSRLPLTGDSLTARVLREGRPVRVDDHVARRADGSAAAAGPARCAVAAPVSVDGALWGTIGALGSPAGLPPDAESRIGKFAALVSLAIASAHTREELLHQAATDPLTGLGNRRHFEARLVEEIARARRDGSPLCVVLLDVDHFKRVNDRFGHGVGDLALSILADRMRRAARASDVLGRIGGEEFAWVLPDTAEADAVVAADRLRRQIAGEAFGDAGRQTISAGVARLEAGDDASALLRRADGRLYDAKEAGRNRVVSSAPG